MSTHEVLEHSEHIAHAGHGGGDGHAAHSTLGTWVGITMAVLGVLLAFCAAKVGGERTELVQTLVEQQNAHAKYQAQDIKHRVAFLDLQTVHAVGAQNADKKDLVQMAKTVDRYLEESQLAKEWVETFDGIIGAHVVAQEHFETAQLAAEIGIVIASVALLTKKRLAWYASLVLGICALGIVGYTFQHTGHIVSDGMKKAAEAETKYRTARNADKTTAYEKQFVEEILESAGAAAPAHGAPAAHEH